MDAWYPPAARRPVPNTASPHPGEGHYLYDVAGPFARTPIGWVLHVVIGNGSPYGTFVGAKSPSRRFSHLWVSKTGAVEQYGPFTHESWATGAANGTYLSAETEGFPNEPLTDAQINALAAFHVWTGFPDHIATAPGEPGITCHYIGGAAWGGHTCPDPAPGAGPRSKQRAAIIAAAVELRGGNKPTPLTVDGVLGAATITRWQTILNTLGAKPPLVADGQAGPATWTAVDVWLGVTPPNGTPGRDTVRALQRELRVPTVNGLLGRDTVRALQRWLNAQPATHHAKHAQ